ncbi:unnamed protein product [Pelagomonas calceolata]|uniref:phosphoglycerate mutase (2,3-diphosphoglycerate-dependent) n=1 Tax=Pelagomonas calceolata TaxID=35677 RepID=A0A8J2SSS0_9STRA|nr:unnamed protein product [Pelagomonas calceolata]
MWSKLQPSVKRLWLGAGGLFIAGNLFKYYTWVIAHDAVSKVEQEAHEDASRQLREARDSAQKYALPPLKNRSSKPAKAPRCFWTPSATASRGAASGGRRCPLRSGEGSASAVLADRGLEVPEIAVDEALVEIDHASWHGKTVDDLSGADRASAAAHRAGDVLAKPPDGESQLDVLERAAAWVHGLDAPDRVVVAFGHGTMQNAIEVVLRTYGSRPPAEVFTRVPGKSHLKRGFPHVVFDADGDVDVPLSERGEAEARAAAQFVADTFGSKVTSVFASPMKRAMYGAERTVEALGKSMSVEAREAFREVRRGDWVDKSIDQVSKEYPGEDMQRFLDDYDFNPAGGGESVNEVQARAKKCLLEDVLPSINEGECAVVVSHLFITRSLLSFAEPSTPVAEISVPTASVSTLEFTGDDVSIDLRGVKPELSAEDDARLAPGSAET